jgi:hypothetical protein
MKARNYLILMAIAILAPVAVIAGAGLSMLLDAERSARIRSVESNARATALLVDREVAAAQAALRALAHSRALREGDFAEVHREATAMNAATPWTWTVLIDYDGSALLNTLVPYGTRLPGRAGPWVARAWDTQQPRVSGYFVGALSRRATVSVDVPAPRAAGGRWILSQIFDADHFAGVFADKGIGADWVVGIMDRDGVSIARNRNSALVGSKARPELVEASRKAHSGMVRHRTRDGIEVYDIFTHSDTTGWTVAIGVPVAEIEAAARAAMRWSALALLVVMGLRSAAPCSSPSACRRHWIARGARPGRCRKAACRRRRPRACTRWTCCSAPCTTRAAALRASAASASCCKTSAKRCCRASARRAAWPRRRARPRTTSSRCWAMSCAIRSPPSRAR